MQQNFFCCPEKTFCLSNQNLIDVAKCFVGRTKEFCCINTNKILLLLLQNCFLSVVQPRKIRPQAKIHNFSFKNSKIATEGIIQKRKDYFLLTNFKHRKIMYLTNFIFNFFFHVASYQIFKNGEV